MTTYESQSGSIVHIELNTDDPEGTRAFLEDAFGWSFEVMEEMNYMSFRPPNPPGGGIVLEQEEGQYSPPRTLFYVDVEDIRETGEAIREAGGETLVEAMEVPEMGIYTVFREPGGVVEAAWETLYEGDPSEDEEMAAWYRFTDDPEPGSVTHFELYSEDPEATRRFHEAVFDWEFETVGDADYTMIRPPTPPNGGLMAATDEMPVGTLLYLLVDDAEEASRAISAADGTVLRDPFEVEGWGTMGVFQAPGGLVMALWESAPAAEAVDEAAEHEVAG